MKNILIITFLFLLSKITAQDINWRSISHERPHLLHLTTGLEYAVTTGVGYGYVLKTKLPIVTSVVYSFPSGKNLLDDFKTEIGAQVRFLKAGDVQLSGKLNGVFRKYKSDYVTLLNFGSNMAVTAGYYKKKWYAAGELGFDKAIVTYFNHSNVYKEVYPQVENGWFEPPTGGNMYFGIQTGYSLPNSDITFRFGGITAEDFKRKPILPFYAKLGYNLLLK